VNSERRLEIDLSESVVCGMPADAGSIHEEIVRILRRIEHWHQGSVTSYRILYQDAAGLGGGEATWDGEKAEFVAAR
jgi:hypothetical protein